MTCIVGVVHKGAVFIGGDSAGVDGHYSLSIRADKKVFRNGDFVMGFTSSFRMGQLLAFSFSPPKPRVGDDLMAFMVKDFIWAARQCLKDGGYARIENSVERGGTFLAGYGGRLFHISDDFQVGEAVHGFDACGCGSDVAQGVLFATKDRDPNERINLALTAAETFSAGVRGPFFIEHAGEVTA